MLDLDAQVLRPLREGTFKLDCSNISLNGQYHGKPVTFSGPGYIDQSPDGGFTATIFVKGSLREAPGNDGRIRCLPGTLVSSEGVFKLEATDLRGQKWLAENIWQPKPNGCVPGDGYVVRAGCHELLLQRLVPTGDTVRCQLELFIGGAIGLPLTPSGGKEIALQEWVEDDAHSSHVVNLRAEAFQACEFEFEIFNHAGWFRARAKSSAVAPPHLASRVWEALHFTLAASEPWSMVTIFDGEKSQLFLHSPRQHSCDSGQWPPFLFRFSPPIENFWQFFRLYLEYTLREKEKPFHPLSGQVLAVSRSGGASLEAQTLTLVVAVEAILNRFYSDVATPAPAHISSVNDLKEHIKSWCGDDQIKQRAIGAVSALSKARAEDRLKSLAQQGVVSERDTKAWKNLRNQAAHGDWSTLHDNLQGHLDRMGAVRTLFYQLIFHLIGYSGHQTDYGTHGYPPVQYPPKEISNERTT